MPKVGALKPACALCGAGRKIIRARVPAFCLHPTAHIFSPSQSRWSRHAWKSASVRLAENIGKTFVPQNTGFGGGLSEVNPRAREQEVGGDHEPEGVIADDRYLDEHARDRKDHR
jgi:hypothetical protein